MKKPSVILWDWNGTLLNDLDFSLSCLNRLLCEHDYPQRFTLAEYQAIFGFPIEEYYVRVGFDFAKHPFTDLAHKYIDIFLEGSSACHTAGGARDVLRAVQNAQIRQVILSASSTDILKEQVAERDLTGFFEELLGLDDIYAKSKTARGIAWMKQSGVDPTTAIMIGDTDHDADVAKAMGVRCILCAAGHQSHETLAKTGCTVIDHLSELPALLHF